MIINTKKEKPNTCLAHGFIKTDSLPYEDAKSKT